MGGYGNTFLIRCGISTKFQPHQGIVGAEGKIAVDVLSKMEQSLVIELCYDMAEFLYMRRIVPNCRYRVAFYRNFLFSRQVHRGFDLFRNGAKRKTKYLPMQHGLHHRANVISENVLPFVRMLMTDSGCSFVHRYNRRIKLSLRSVGSPPVIQI